MDEELLRDCRAVIEAYNLNGFHGPLLRRISDALERGREGWIAILPICPKCGEKHPMHSEWTEGGSLRTWDQCITCDWSQCGSAPLPHPPGKREG